MIPKGTKLIGSCNVVKSVDRVNITFNTMVFPNGQEIKFNGIALHNDGSGGVPGRVDKQKARLPAKVFLSAAATGASVAAPATSVPAEMIKGIAEDVNQEMNEKQDYSISIKKNTSIQICIINRVEY
jgi:type IV secretory pathway VirB10-like protein